MRSLVLATICLIALTAGAQTADPKRASFEEYMAYHERMWAIESRANALRPRRRETPMRELNISDNEVREIEQIAGRYLLKSMLNISPVVTGCACEEGPLCTDQVYVTATTSGQTVGLQLSRVRNAWVVGAVQRWWIRYAALLQRRADMDYFDFDAAEKQMLEEFPMCVGKNEGEETK